MSNISSFDDLEREIEKTKEEYYSENGSKNFFFKKQQKYDCAKKVVNQFSLEVLLQRTCSIVDNTYYVHVDYPILKSYASPETFETIADYIIMNFQYIKDTYNKLEVIMNLDGFTVSGAERYKKLIEIFCNKCFQRNTGLSLILTRFVVYNSPNIIESIQPIVLPFMEENVKEKLCILSRKESDEYNAVFHPVHLTSGSSK